jgi:hypothetical protein
MENNARSSTAKNAFDIISVIICFSEIAVPLFFIDSKLRVGRTPIVIFIILVNFIPFAFSFFYLLIRCVNASKRVFGDDATTAFAYAFRKYFVFASVALFILLTKTITTDSHIIYVGLFFTIPVVMNCLYGAIRFIEWRRCHANSRLP